MSGRSGADDADEDGGLPRYLFFLAEQQAILLRSLWRSCSRRSMRSLLIGILLMLVAMPRNPQQLSFHSREQSLSALTDPATAHLWAQNGFHTDGKGVSCFHCAAHTDQLAKDPLQWHSNLRPDCHLLRLLRLLITATSAHPASDDGVERDAVGFEKLLKGLAAALRDPVTGFVESFGFSKEEVALAVAAKFISTGGPGVMRPGDLMELLDSVPSAAVAGKVVLLLMKLLPFGNELLVMNDTQWLVTRLDPRNMASGIVPLLELEGTRGQMTGLDLLISHALGSDSHAPDIRVTADPDLNNSRLSTAGQLLDEQRWLVQHLGIELLEMNDTRRLETRLDPRNMMSVINEIQNEISGAATTTSLTAQQTQMIQQQLGGDDSPLCRQCRKQPRDVLLLPCTHLLFCQLCVLDASHCPCCGSSILARLMVFLC